MALRRLLIAFVIVVGGLLCAERADAATIKVCTTGCDQTPANLQTAINNASPGDVIVLEATTYSGTFLLRQKSCPAANDTCYITIRGGVTSTGTLLNVNTYPAADIRIASTQTSLPVLTPSSNNVAAIRTIMPAETGSGCVSAPCISAYYKLQWIELKANSYGGNALLILGNNDTSGAVTSGDTQDTAAEEPHHFIVDQVVFRGDPVIGQERAIQISARDVTIKNSYIKDMKSIADKQAIWTDNSTGNITLTNNYIEGGSENFLAGGDIPRMNTDTTVSASPAPSTTVFAIGSVKDYLVVGSGISVTVGGLKKYTHVTNIAGSTLTVEALSGAPDVGGAVNYSVVPKNLTVTKNNFTKQPSWMNPIVSTAQSLTAAAALTGGTLPSGTYSYKITATLIATAGQTTRSTASAEVSATVASGTTGKVTISWAAVPNADYYYIYGRSSGGQNLRQYVAAPATSFVDTGTATTGACSGAQQTACTQNVPTSTGGVWAEKNLFELKKWHTATIEGNEFDYSWKGLQSGTCTLLTVLNNSTGTDGNDSTVVRNITIRNNRYRHCVQAFQLTGIAADGDISDRTRDITIYNNIFEDLGSAWGAKDNVMIVTTGNNAAYTGTGNRGPLNVLVDHNTFINAEGKSGPLFDLYKASEQHECQNCDFTNNLLRKNDYGLRNQGSGGLETEGNTSWVNGTDGSSSWANNVMAGASCGSYPGTPASTYCPSEATFQAAFANYAGGNYRVTSQFATLSSTGGPVGADIDAIEAFTTIAISGDNSGGGGTTPIPPTIVTSVLPNATRGSTYSTTLAATGGTSPYTWTVNSGSTLPTGLALSTSGVLSGTATVAGANTFTVKAAGANAAFTTQTYTLTIIEILNPSQRPDNANWVEIGVFRRETCPIDVTDLVRVGDLCFNLTDNNVYKATTTAPGIVWIPMGVPAGQTLTMYAGAAAATTNVAVGGAELVSATSYRVKADTTNSSQIAVTANITAACAGTTPKLRIEYWDGAAWQATGGEVTCAIGLQEGTFSTLAVGARAQDIAFRGYYSTGDGAADPAVTTVQIRLR